MIEKNQQLELNGSYLQSKFLWLEEPSPADEKPWLVFLHEALGCIRLWRDVPERLVAETGLPALVFERFGSGQSNSLPRPRTQTYLHEEAWQVLPQILNKCGIEKCILIGHSDGGSIALLHAARYPKKVVGLVVEAAHVFVEPETLQGIRNAGEAYRQTDLRKKLMRYHGDQTDGLFQAWQETWLAPAFADWNIEAELEKITAPVLVIQGADDAFGTRSQVDAILTQVSGPGQHLWLSDCGHEPHREARNEVLPAIADFIRGLQV